MSPSLTAPTKQKKRSIETSRPEPDSQVGIRLREAREERGFTQGAAAVRTKLVDPKEKGISRTALIGYEQGTSSPGMREIRLLCDVLQVTPNWLVYGTESAAPAVQTSLEFFAMTRKRELTSAVNAALVLAALKGHERDAVLSLSLSLAGRQLGDVRLSGLLGLGQMLSNRIEKEFQGFMPDLEPTTPLEEIADALSKEMRIGGVGNRLKFDEEGEVNGGSWMHPDPDKS